MNSANWLAAALALAAIALPHAHAAPLVGLAAIETGYAHTCALTNTGAVKCWGLNDNGQLGDGTTTSRSSVGGVIGLESGVSAISAGARHNCVIDSFGGAKCWGSN